MKMPFKKIRNSSRRFRPLSSQIAFWFIGLLLLSMFGTTLINGLFLEHYYISRKTEVLQDAVSQLKQLDIIRGDNGVYCAEVSDEMFKECSENNLTWVMITADGQSVCSVGSNEDLLEARLVGYVYDLDQKKTEGKILLQGNGYVIQQISDRFAGMEYVESWGEVTNECYFLIRTPLESIRESVSISNKFYFYVGVMIIIISGMVIWFVTKRITKPIRELTTLSTKMSDLDFDAKYQRHSGNEIDELGENFNRMSKQLEKTISELKSANNQLLKDIENKERIDQMRQEFLNNVSHELKTPIALIQGYAEGLKENISEDPESREFYCDVIMDEASKMNKLVRNLLTLNQLELGRDEVTMERFDIVSVIRGVIQSMDIMIQQKEASLSFEAEEPVYVWADEFKIEEVVTNYISNALNHLNGEKEIEIRVLMENDHVKITVFNTGNPIPESDIPNLWNKFYKVDKARTREYGGSGIGLSIVRAIMEGLHQKYGVQNYDNGVEFWFTLDRKIGKTI